jgi:hypothetical protein
MPNKHKEKAEKKSMGQLPFGLIHWLPWSKIAG